MRWLDVNIVDGTTTLAAHFDGTTTCSRLSIVDRLRAITAAGAFILSGGQTERPSTRKVLVLI